MEKQSEYRYNSKPYKVDSMQSINIPPEAQNGSIEMTGCRTLGDYANKDNKSPYGVSQHDKALDKILVADSDEEIEWQWQRIKTSLAILRNLHNERANMEFWSRLEMVAKGMR